MPEIVELPGRPYIGVRGTITMTTFGLIADRISEIIGWLAERGESPAGPPFLRYESIDLAGDRLVVQAGVPVAAPLEGERDLFAATLPAGRYASVTHHGHPDGLFDVVEALLKWGEEQGLSWDMTADGDAEHWGCRLELFMTDPRIEPDLHKWDTELQFRLT